jgi:YhcH/YjgK/YiaL family protein
LADGAVHINNSRVSGRLKPLFSGWSFPAVRGIISPMIVDAIKNRNLYAGISPGLGKALDFLHRADVREFAEKKVEIDGKDIFALFQSYRTEDGSGKPYEAHNRYIDVQYIVSGTEVIRVCGRSFLVQETPYDEGKDVMFYHPAPGTDVVLREGDFAVLFPEDAHLPKLFHGNSGDVKKIVMKVRVAG